ncbi:hypothetical protein GO491_00870 [Flavobacteriaceae bacterium Ap0902]|nr:hypothetical protein [Flavobacteriaceae bacterium Ap0902]
MKTDVMNKKRIILVLLFMLGISQFSSQETQALREKNDTVYIYFNPKDTTVCKLKIGKGMLGSLVGKKDTIVDRPFYRKHQLKKNTSLYQKGDIKFSLCGIKAGYVYRKEKHKSYLIEDYTQLKLRRIETSFDFSDVHQKTKFIVELLCDKVASLYEVESGIQVRE